MARFVIRATDGSYVSTEIPSIRAEAVFTAVQWLESKEADILADDVYAFSVRLDASGVWAIFTRDHSGKSQFIMGRPSRRAGTFPAS